MTSDSIFVEKQLKKISPEFGDRYVLEFRDMLINYLGPILPKPKIIYEHGKIYEIEFNDYSDGKKNASRDELQKISDELNCGILLISHDLHTVMSATDHVVCLNGHVCCSGSPIDVAKNNEYKALFGEQASQILSRYEHKHDHVHTNDGEIKKN